MESFVRNTTSSFVDVVKSDPNVFALVPFSVIWIASYVYCYRYRGGIEAFARCSAVHQFHAAGVCLLAALSLYCDDDDIFSESIPIFFSSTYFVADFLDCLVRKDVMFLVHAAVSLGLGFCAFVDGPFRDMRLMSRGYMIELSNVQLHRWKMSKTKENFALFVALFTLTRMFFLPTYIMWEVADTIGVNNVIFAALLILFLLQVGWWVKMLEMLSNYKIKLVEVEDTLYSSDGESMKNGL